MITYQQALAQILALNTPELSSERVPLASALDRVVAADLPSPLNLPGFDNSAMDGFAVHGGGHRLAAGSRFDVVGEQAAGDAAHPHSQGAVEIMTGAVLPAGLDAVVPVEQVQREGTQITLLDELMPGANIRRAGEDIARGELAASAGMRVTPARLMLLAALGLNEIPVHRRVRVALFNTGRELVDSASELAEGQIHNSNGPFLAARLALAGCSVVCRETLADDVAEALMALNRARDLGADLVITTGAVSMGRYDFIPELLSRAGAQTLFHKVAIRPGKPVLMARLPSGALYFGLPGNPISAAVGLRFFVEPALRVLNGLAAETPLRMPLLAAVRKRPGLRFFQKARVEIDGNALGVRLLPGQESFRIRPLAESNAWAVLPEDASDVPAGSLLDVYSPGTFEALDLEAGSL